MQNPTQLIPSSPEETLPTKHFKSFWPIVIIAVLSALIGGGLVFALYSQGMEDEVNSLMPGVKFNQHGYIADLKDWQTYRNEEYGLEFRYPKKYILNADISNKNYTEFWITLSKEGEEGSQIQISLGDSLDHSTSLVNVDYLDLNGIKWTKSEYTSEFSDKDTYFYYSGKISAVVAKNIALDFEKILSTFKFTTDNLQLIRACPEEWYENRMPSVGESETVKEYYIYKGKRAEIAEFDSAWVKANCKIEKEVVY